MNLVVMAICTLCACEKNFRYDALDGFWRVDEVTDLTTGTTAEYATGIVTGSPSQLFMSFEYSFVKLSWLFENRNTGCLGYEYIAACEKEDDSLSFGTFYVYRTEDTPAPADKLASFGIPYNSPCSFAYTFSDNGAQLTLTNSSTQIRLTKY